MTGNVALTLVPGAVRQIRACAPDLDATIVPVDRRRAPEMLARGQADAVAGAWAGPVDAALRRTTLYRERLVLVACDGHPVFNVALDAQSLVAYPQVAVAPTGEPDGTVDRALAGLGLARRVALTVETYLLALEALAATDLVAILAKGPVQRLGRRLGVRHAALPMPLDPITIDLVTTSGAGTLHDWLQEVLTPAALLPEAGCPFA